MGTTCATEESQSFTAQDLTLLAYSFAKLGFCFTPVFEAIAESAFVVIRDFTAHDLQMVAVAYARAQHWNASLFDALAAQANRRVAQFTAEALALMLRVAALYDRKTCPLFGSAIVQLPRVLPKCRPTDITMYLHAFAAVQIRSVALFDIITPCILERAPFFTSADWLSALRGYSLLGHKDSMFLSAFGLHIEPAKLSSSQLCTAMVNASRLSCPNVSELL